ncbi:MAG: acyl carrier protein [Longimicrobiaceae bacterium]
MEHLEAAAPRAGTVLDDVVRMVEELSTGWDHGFGDPIGEDTGLVGDLGFESMDVVMLLVAIEGHYQRQDFPFDQLLTRDGQYVTELRVGDVAAFLARSLAQPAGARP